MKLKSLAVFLASLGLATSVFAVTVSDSSQTADAATAQATQPASPAATVRRHRTAKAKSSATQANAKQKIDINTADAKALSSLKGIGKKRAQEIVNFRNQNGEFKSVDDLSKVKGISQKVIEKNRNRLTIG